MTFFFARISESAEVQRLLRAESFALIAGARGVGTTALLSHEYSRWQGAKHFIPAHAHDGGDAEILSGMQRALGLEPDGESVLQKRVTLFAKTLKRLDSHEATFLAVDNVSESSTIWLRSLAKETPWLTLAASITAKPTEPFPSDAVVLPPFSTVQRDVRGPSEAAAFVMGSLRAANPLWIEGRSDSAMVEEVVEVLGGNALLLSRLVSVAVDRGFAYVLEKVRSRALGEVTDVLVKDVREHLSEEAKATVEFVAILPATIGHQTLRSIFVGVSSQKPHAWDDTFATLCARSLLVLDAVGRVTVPSEFRSRAESYSNLQPRLEDAARGLIHEYASFDSRLAKDLGRAVATFRYDQGLLRWVALTLADRTLAVQVAIILARFAVYSADDQTLSVLLRSSENLEPALRVEALFALAEAYRAVGKPDRADPVVEELLRLVDPRAQATGLITRTRLRWKRNDFQGAQRDISAALKLRTHLREPELVRALLGRAIISMSICEFENASREFRAALEFVDERG
ncbi:MAG: hypothetical protein KBF88_16400, partial [Polyangiaceae bacterium]|nr:hypothetical protein [Polyangiaceae bacterium]